MRHWTTLRFTATVLRSGTREYRQAVQQGIDGCATTWLRGSWINGSARTRQLASEHKWLVRCRAFSFGQASMRARSGIGDLRCGRSQNLIRSPTLGRGMTDQEASQAAVMWRCIETHHDIIHSLIHSGIHSVIHSPPRYPVENDGLSVSSITARPVTDTRTAELRRGIRCGRPGADPRKSCR